MTSGSVHKDKDKKEKKKKTKKKKKSNKSSPLEETELNYGGSGDEVIDLDEEMHPIGYYINDREEMINQMFSVIKPDKLRAMLPPILKESSVDELKAYCLDELLGMSSKRINSVLEGRELETSSESDDESIIAENDKSETSSSVDIEETHWSSDEKIEVPEPPEPEGAYSVEDRSGAGNDMDMLEIGITSEEMGELLDSMPSNQKNEQKRRPENEEPSASCSKKRKWRPKSLKVTCIENARKLPKKDREDDKNVSIEKSFSDERNESTAECNTEDSKGKTLLEILELEMRARAIRALLKQQVGTGEGDDATNEKDNTAETTTTISDEKKENSISNIISHSQNSKDSDLDVHSTTSSDGLTMLTVKKLKQGIVKPVSASVQCTGTSNAVSTDAVVSQSKNGDSVKGIKEETDICCLENVVVKSEVSTDEQAVPDLESNSMNEGNITDSKTIESDESISMIDREDGELSTDGEKSLDSIVEIKHDTGSSDVIVLESEDELLDSAPPEKQETPSSSEDIQQHKCNETEEIEVIDLVSADSPKQGHEDDNNYKSGEISNKEEPALSSCGGDNDGIEDSSSNKKPAEDINESTTTEANPEVDDFTKDDSSESHSKKNESVDISWAARWLQSKGVQKVVSTSKMCAKIRKRMKTAQKEKKINAERPQQEETKEQSVVIVGSVNEYNMLDKPKSSQKESCEESHEKDTDVGDSAKH